MIHHESRSVGSNPLGKLTAEVPKIMVSEETKEILEAEARRAGMNFNEFHRFLLDIRAHGIDMVARLHAERLRVVAGNETEMGQQ